MENKEIIMLVATPLTSGIIGYLLAYIRHMTETKVAEHKEREKVLQELLENYKETAKKQEATTAHLEQLDKKMAKISTKMDNVANGGVSLLRDRIIQSCRVFIERGKITLTAKTNIQDLYHYYHDVFGGNGIGEYYYIEMNKLPVEDTPMVSSLKFEEEHHDTGVD